MINPKKDNRKKNKEEKRSVRQKPNQCDNCDGTGLVSYKKLNPVSKKHEQVKETCIVCSGAGGW